MNQPRVIVTSYSVPVPNPKSKKLIVHECECGQMIWAFPWDDDLASYVSYQRSPLRSLIDERGLAPKFPQPKMHVVFASPEDRPLLELRRWRVWPTRPRCRAKWELKAGPHGLPLQRMILAGAKVVRFRDGNGMNVQRENLVAMTKQELAAECSAKATAKRREKREQQQTKAV